MRPNDPEPLWLSNGCGVVVVNPPRKSTLKPAAVQRLPDSRVSLAPRLAGRINHTTVSKGLMLMFTGLKLTPTALEPRASV